MPIESELKFTVLDEEIFARLAAFPEIAGYETHDTGAHAHRDTYFDTADRLLLRSKVVFRLREKESGAMLTFKAQADSGADFYRRIEIEAPTDATADDIERGDFPEAPPVDELRKRFGNIALLPALSVVNNRRTILLLFRCGQPGFELALDDVMFSGPRGTAHVLELEVESLDDDSALPEIGEWLREEFSLAPAGPSKYILGMELVGNGGASH